MVNFQFEQNQIFGGRYNLQHQLGIGGFSEVWLAHDQMAGDMPIAIKIFAPGKGLVTDGIKQFSNEFKIVFNLNHSNILKPSNFDVWQGMPYLIMAFVEKGPASKLAGKISPEQLEKFIIQGAEALAYLHQQYPPIVHQDIKPDNFLIDSQGNYLLTDFGISSNLRRTLTVSMGMTSAQASSGGTQAYMPPEKFSKNIGERKPSPASDMWAFGSSIFELASGEMPFGNLGGINQLTGVEIPTLPNEYAKFQPLVNACLQLKPNDRISATEIEQTLKSGSNNNLNKVKTFAPKLKTQPHNPEIMQKGQPPKNYLVEAILVSVFCCMPFGIPAIINSTRVKKRFYRGDIEGAQHASEQAYKFVKIALWIGIGLTIFSVITTVITNL